VGEKTHGFNREDDSPPLYQFLQYNICFYFPLFPDIIDLGFLFAGENKNGDYMGKEKEPELEAKHREDLERLHNLRLLDDDFMTKVFEDTKCAEFLLQIILKRDDLKVTKSTTQYGIKNLQGLT
jgi:hypothetical protein